jgi:hypothetical protein
MKTPLQFTNKITLDCVIEKNVAKSQAKNLKKILQSTHDIDIGSSLSHHCIAKFYNSPSWGHFSANTSAINKCRPDDFSAFLLSKIDDKRKTNSLNVNKLISLIFFPMVSEEGIAQLIPLFPKGKLFYIVNQDHYNQSHFFIIINSFIDNTVAIKTFLIINNSQGHQDLTLIKTEHIKINSNHFSKGHSDLVFKAIKQSIPSTEQYLSRKPLSDITAYAEVLCAVKSGISDYLNLSLDQSSVQTPNDFITHAAEEINHDLIGTFLYNQDIRALLNNELVKQANVITNNILTSLKKEASSLKSTEKQTGIVFYYDLYQNKKIELHTSIINNKGESIGLYDLSSASSGFFYSKLTAGGKSRKNTEIDKLSALTKEAALIKDEYAFLIAYKDNNTKNFKLFKSNDNNAYNLFILNYKLQHILKIDPSAGLYSFDESHKLIHQNLINGNNSQVTYN